MHRCYNSLNIMLTGIVTMKVSTLIALITCLALVTASCAAGKLPNALQITNQPGGWQIYPGQGYRYGPSIICNSDGSIDAWFAASCYDGQHWDQIRYRHSKDGGRTWEQPDDVVVVTPTDDSPDRYSCCDPGAIRFGGYYYVGYTAVDNKPGQRNHVFLARSKSPRGPYEKWNGKGWGGAPEPFLRYYGDPKQWGCGEPSFVLKEGKLYVFYTWNEGSLFTNLAVCNDVTSDDWPAHMILKGHVIKHDEHAEDSLDMKWVDSLQRFVAIATYNRVFNLSSTISVWQSADGITWTRCPFRGVRAQSGCHNAGISGNAIGHIDGKSKPFISYSYGWPNKDWTGQDFGWANWATYIDPITIGTAPPGQPVHVEVSSAPKWDTSGPCAIDGNPGTAWVSANHDRADAKEWAYVWLGSAYPIDGLLVTPATGGFPVDFTLQHSNDGKRWSDIRSYTSCPDPAGKPKQLVFGKTISAAYFRILAQKLSSDSSGGYAMRLAEISTILRK